MPVPYRRAPARLRPKARAGRLLSGLRFRSWLGGTRRGSCWVEVAHDFNNPFEIARFVEEVIGPQLHAALAILGMVKIGEHDHHWCRFVLLHRLQHLNAAA